MAESLGQQEKKKVQEPSSHRPFLRLLDNCSLCVDAKEAIFKAFPNQFTLQEVDITAPENKHWYKAYRYDIPVFHFDGQFLMKHRADIDLLRKKLEEFAQEGK